MCVCGYIFMRVRQGGRMQLFAPNNGYFQFGDLFGACFFSNNSTQMCLTGVSLLEKLNCGSIKNYLHLICT